MPALDDLPEAEVAQLIRDSSTGEGLTEDYLASWLKEEKLVADEGAVEAARLLHDRIVLASELVTNKDHREAIRNALSLDGQGDNLTERRMNYLTNVDISYRTLIRHETEGAKAIAKLLPRVTATAAGASGFGLISERLDDIEAVLLAIAGIAMNSNSYYASMSVSSDTLKVQKRDLGVDQLRTAIGRIADRYAAQSSSSGEDAESD